MPYVVKRIIIMLITLVGVSLVAFFMLNLTGDPTNLLLPDDATPAEREEFREMMGFDKPLTEQYYKFAKDLLKGDFGYSYYYKVPAISLVLERLPATIKLMAASMLLIIGVSVPIAISGTMGNSKIIKGIDTVITFFGQSFPNFVNGILLILVFSVFLGWLPPGGNEKGIKSLILPSIVLMLYGAPQMIRVLRTSLGSVKYMDFVRTARAKGQTEMKIMIFHILRNALIPFITALGVQMGILMGGSIVTETVFSWPGIGQLMITAINNRDYPVVQAGVLMTAFFIMSINLIVDLLYAVIDPRIRYD
ncbi:MAG: ABC transporter permease [Acetivibrionales bacterium]|jgi:peptide/nickel transport system permease protein